MSETALEKAKQRMTDEFYRKFLLGEDVDYKTILRDELKKENIIFFTKEEFYKTYPDAFETADGKFTKLPMEKFIIMGEFIKRIGFTYLAIDNTTGDAWTEDFHSIEQAYAWIKGDGATPRYKVAIIPSPQKIGNRWRKEAK